VFFGLSLTFLFHLPYDGFEHQSFIGFLSLSLLTLNKRKNNSKATSKSSTIRCLELMKFQRLSSQGIDMVEFKTSLNNQWPLD
jgi:hypothetical protein